MYSTPVSHRHSWEVLAGLHGSPTPSYCVHGYPGFLTWHRAYLLEFAHALARTHSGVTLP